MDVNLCGLQMLYNMSGTGLIGMDTAVSEAERKLNTGLIVSWPSEAEARDSGAWKSQLPNQDNPRKFVVSLDNSMKSSDWQWWSSKPMRHQSCISRVRADSGEI